MDSNMLHVKYTGMLHTSIVGLHSTSLTGWGCFLTPTRPCQMCVCVCVGGGGRWAIVWDVHVYTLRNIGCVHDWFRMLEF